jgi:hypothetical protein
MLRATGFVFFILIFQSSFAAQLCDAGCALDITFPSGGSIEAVDGLTFSFGDAAQVDTVTTAMAPVRGEVLNLNAGESLQFAAGGKFHLGNQGNLNFTSIMIHTDGVVEVAAIAGSKTLYIPAGSSFVISSQATILFDARHLVLEGVLTRDVEQ